MSLTNEAWLLIDDGTGETAQFQLQIGFQETTEVTKSYIAAERGQFLSQIAENNLTEVAVTATAADNRRTGWWLDGGAGSVTFTIEFKTGPEDVTWGDGSGGRGQSGVTTTDASGEDIDPISRKQILEYWIRRTRTDSAFGQARLHWGEWTDGSVGGVSPGVYDQPIPVAIVSSSIRSPEVEGEVSNLQGTLELARIAIFEPPVSGDLPSWVTDIAVTIQEKIDDIRDG